MSYDETIAACIRLHRSTDRREMRSDDELAAYYQGLRDNSPFATLASVMEATPRVMGMRAEREARERKAAYLEKMLTATYAYLLKHYGVRSKIRIDADSDDGRVKIWVSRLTTSSLYQDVPLVDKTEAEFVVWFNSNVKED